MSASGGIEPFMTRPTARWRLSRPHPVIWSQPAVVTYRWESGRVVAKLLAGPHPSWPVFGFVSQRGVEKSMSSDATRMSCLASSAESGRPAPSGLGAMIPSPTALRAAVYSRPAIPLAWPVASDEHDDDSN